MHMQQHSVSDSCDKDCNTEGNPAEEMHDRGP
jgi:hypothetical protein